jgi:hypothetical protein
VTDPHTPSRATLRIVQAVAHHLHLDPSSIFGRDRHRTATIGRQVVIFVLREHQHPQPSWPEIGRELSRDHTTCMSAMKSIVRKAVIDEHVRDAIEIGRIALQSLDVSREVRRLALLEERNRLVRRAGMLNEELAALRNEVIGVVERDELMAVGAAE